MSADANIHTVEIPPDTFIRWLAGDIRRITELWQDGLMADVEAVRQIREGLVAIDGIFAHKERQRADR